MPTANKQVTKVNNYAPPQEGDLLEEFENQHPSYKLFKEKGLGRDKTSVDQNGNPTSTINRILDDGVFRLQRRFLNNVDLSKGPIQRKVVRMERRRDMNPNTNKMQESLVVHTHWVAKDFLGNMIAQDDILEGMHNQPVVQTTLVGGKRATEYVSWLPVYDIPFTKEAVNEALENQINPPDVINYFVRVSRTQRDNTYSLEQFRDSTFEECQEINRKGSGLNR